MDVFILPHKLSNVFGYDESGSLAEVTWLSAL